MTNYTKKTWRVWENSKDAPYLVYSHEVRITTTGDLVFHNFVEDGKMPDGQPAFEGQITLILPSGSWSKMEQLVDGETLYQTTGSVSSLAA